MGRGFYVPLTGVICTGFSTPQVQAIWHGDLRSMLYKGAGGDVFVPGATARDAGLFGMGAGWIFGSVYRACV